MPPRQETNKESGGGRATWDLFISHASEDKTQVARPLAEILRKEGLKVWYDEFELRLGDKLRRRIDYGLQESRFGVVIFSRHFFAKKWTQYELDGLFTRESADSNVILPVWHNIKQSEIAKFSPALADRKAVSTSEGLHIIAQVILARVSRLPKRRRGRGGGRQRPAESKVLQESSRFLAENAHKSEINEAIRSCLRSPRFPKEMWIKGQTFYNPVYDYTDKFFLKSLLAHPQRFMPLDIYLIKANDEHGNPLLLQYFSGNKAFGWQCWLFPHGFRPEQPNAAKRFSHDARDFEAHWRLRRSAATISPIEGSPVALSIKPDFGYRDQLVVYLYTFCFLTLSFVPDKFACSEFAIKSGKAERKFRWMSLDDMTANAPTRERNADVHRCIHHLFARSLIDVPFAFKRAVRTR